MSTMKLSTIIDNKNTQFTSAVKNQLQDLTKFSEAALEWLMMEHYQFSLRNTAFLATAVENTEAFAGHGVPQELQRNYNEELSHAAIYKKSLSEIGTDVDKRLEFFPTTYFFSDILKLITISPSVTLGAIYATETAAIFEHEVFWAISREVMKRRGLKWERSRLKAFHDLHLNGVEQSHKDELGVFVDQESLILNKNIIKLGAVNAIESMDVWWKALLKQAVTMS